MNVLQKFRVLWHGRTELTEVPDTDRMDALQNLKKFRVRVNAHSLGEEFELKRRI